MKKIMFILAFTLLAAPQGGAQDIPEFESKEQAIEVLRNSDFLEILRYPDQTEQNIERLVCEIGKVATVDRALKKSLDKVSSHCDIVFWPWGGTPFFEERVRQVLEQSIGRSKLERVSVNMRTAVAAYDYLTLVQMNEQEAVVRGVISNPEYIDNVYAYFGI